MCNCETSLKTIQTFSKEKLKWELSSLKQSLLSVDRCSDYIDEYKYKIKMVLEELNNKKEVN